MLKSAGNERIERKVLKITGSGMENVKFAVRLICPRSK